MIKILMRNIKNILIIFSIIFLVSGCNTIRKGFTPDKRSGEEFLVEKKSPLVIPPSYNELPIPSQNKVQEKDRKSNVKSLLLGSKEKVVTDVTNDESVSTIEKLILNKIKKNN
tara:strand:+ start:350 stop:688 length:339 start_codon:yes stop_codon:yes gene_type:complete